MDPILIEIIIAATNISISVIAFRYRKYFLGILSFIIGLSYLFFAIDLIFHITY